MDVNTIQKINDLALKLCNQTNMTRDEAVRQAEMMISKKGSMFDDDTGKIEKKEEKQENNNSEEIKEIPKQEPKQEMRPDWEEIVFKNTQFIAKSLKDMNETICNLKKEVRDMKSAMERMSMSTPKQRVVTNMPDPTNPQPQPVPPQPEQPKTTQNINNTNNSNQNTHHPHPKGGDEKGNFSVEKIFYMGKR